MPNWHSLSEVRAPINEDQHRFPLSSQIDFNGVGIYKNIHLKSQNRSRFAALNPTLPFFLEDTRIRSNYGSRNCLSYIAKDNVIVQGSRNSVKRLKVEETEDYLNSDRFNTMAGVRDSTIGESETVATSEKGINDRLIYAKL